MQSGQFKIWDNKSYTWFLNPDKTHYVADSYSATILCQALNSKENEDKDKCKKNT